MKRRSSRHARGLGLVLVLCLCAPVLASAGVVERVIARSPWNIQGHTIWVFEPDGKLTDTRTLNGVVTTYHVKYSFNEKTARMTYEIHSVDVSEGEVSKRDRSLIGKKSVLHYEFFRSGAKRRGLLILDKQLALKGSKKARAERFAKRDAAKAKVAAEEAAKAQAAPSDPAAAAPAPTPAPTTAPAPTP